MNPFIANRQLEYIAFKRLMLNTQLEGLVHWYMAVDAFSGYVLFSSVERDDKPETVLKCIYLLTEKPEFLQYADQSFTVVTEEFEDIFPRINSILERVNGKVELNVAMTKEITLPAVSHFANYAKNITK